MSSLYLLTIGSSPYSEKARWALDLLGRSYVEDRYVPPFHRAALQRINAGTTTPALMVNRKDTYRDSSEILAWVSEQLPPQHKLFPDDPVQGPIVRDFCTRCNSKFAPEVIAFLTVHLSSQQWAEVCGRGVAPQQLSKFRWLAPLIFFFFKRRQRIHLSNLKLYIKRIDQFLLSVDHLLDGGKNYLYGDKLTAADITFCAYAGALLCLREFGGSTLDLSSAPEALVQEVQRWRETSAGRFVQSFYKDWRKRHL